MVALGAEALDAQLRAHTGPQGLRIPGLSRDFQKHLAKVIATPWSMATGEDLRWPVPENVGRLSWPTRLLQTYVDRVQAASLKSPAACEAFYRVSQMLDAPTALFHPSILWTALTAGAPAPQRPRWPPCLWAAGGAGRPACTRRLGSLGVGCAPPGPWRWCSSMSQTACGLCSC